MGKYNCHWAVKHCYVMISLARYGLAWTSEGASEITIEHIQELITGPGEQYIPIMKLTRPAQTPCALLPEAQSLISRRLLHGKINRSTT
jgi:hypothetical protein